MINQEFKFFKLIYYAGEIEQKNKNGTKFECEIGM